MIEGFYRAFFCLSFALILLLAAHPFVRIIFRRIDRAFRREAEEIERQIAGDE